MGLRTVISVLGVGLTLGVASCNQPGEEPKPDAAPPPGPTEPAGPVAMDPAFQNAPAFDCGATGEIRVAYEMGATRTARIRLPDGRVLELAMAENAIEPSYSNATDSFADIGNGTMTLNTATIKGASCMPVSKEVPPPTIAGVARDLKAEDAGKTIELKIGEKFSVSLSGVPTAGYVWGVEKLPDVLAKREEASGNTSTAQSQPGFAGGNHWEVTSFEAVKAGSGELELSQRRPWEKEAAPDDQRWKVKVVVK